MQPLAHELFPTPGILDAFRRCIHLPGCLLLDSAMQVQSSAEQPLGRYSFLMADPFEWIVCPVGQADPLLPVRERLQAYQLETIEGLPPFQGGIAGLLSYDLNRSFESITPQGHDEFGLPALAVGCYDVVIAWDHQQNRSWIFSSGFPATTVAERTRLASARSKQFEKIFSSRNCEPALTTVRDRQPPIPVANQFEVPGPIGLTSNFSAAQYLAAVQKCIDYIYAGDVFQINLAQRLLFPENCPAAELYERLRQCNPAPFSGYFDLKRSSDTGPHVQIVSASPERFIAVRDRVVETRPIKGTRRRTGTPLVDIHAKAALENSVKDRAENTMIVDLMRNDLSRCCTDDSIEVTQFCELEQYQSVLHLVSAVQGKLKPECDLVDLIESVFPGGSITGAPKVRSMEIIAELEPNVRGAYCGALGYFGFNGNADFSILIRTITVAGGWWQIPVGGGIVSQSIPTSEYDETWTKAAGMLRALNTE